MAAVGILQRYAKGLSDSVEEQLVARARLAAQLAHMDAQIAKEQAELADVDASIGKLRGPNPPGQAR